MEDDLHSLLIVKESFEARWLEIKERLRLMINEIEDLTNISSQWWKDQRSLSETLSNMKEVLDNFSSVSSPSREAAAHNKLRRIEVIFIGFFVCICFEK